ncbi:MAG: UDP-N-acetylglucosamine 2-epimerase (hydrolyzing) [bacterium]|nr:UDP-N-acetylglucosamine 2-epimerase (hydrolyzing) [bacterium]
MVDPLGLTIISTSRSDFGLLAPVGRAAQADARFRSLLVTCGQHLESGTPYAEECAGLRIEPLPRPQHSLGLVHQEALRALLAGERSEVVLVLGDRYELLEACMIAAHAGLVLAHSCGGERTFGALDDCIRDAVSKLAYLHFPAHEAAAQRLRSLGEEPWRIRVVGDPGLDGLLAEPRLDAGELSRRCEARPGRDDVVVVVHPVTRSPGEDEALVEAVAGLAGSSDRQWFLSSPNGDPGSDAIVDAWRRLAAASPRCHRLPSLGAQAFRSLVRACGAMVGNSSAGLIEAPLLGTPTVNLGSRQGGRLRGDSVVQVDLAELDRLPAIVDAVVGATRCPPPFACPYGDGHAVPRILDALAELARRPDILMKA